MKAPLTEVIMSNHLDEVVKAVHRLAATDENGPGVEQSVLGLRSAVAAISGTVPAVPARKADMDSVQQQIEAMRSAAATPAVNYKRIVDILDGLRHAAILAKRPQNAAVRPKIAAITEKLAGVFAEVDTVQDLNKPLEAIEKAVHGLYGDQSKNATFYFERRGKGHHGKGE